VAADKDWVEGFLKFYGYGPSADAPDPAGQKCQFNSEQTTTSAVLDQAADQAKLAGYKLDRGSAQQIAKALYDALLKGQQPAPQVPRLATKEGWTCPPSPGEDPGAWVQRFLTFFGFRRDPAPLSTSSKAKFWFNNTSKDLDFILDTVVAQGAIDGLKVDRAKAEAVAAALLPPLVPPVSGKVDNSTQLTIGFMFVPKQIHTTKAGTTTTDPPTFQVQGQYTIKLHKEGNWGFETSPVFQGSFSVTKDDQKKVTKVVEQPMVGVQEALVTQQFFNKMIQLQAFVQFLMGATLEQDIAINGSVTCQRALPTVQVAAGVQSVFTVPGTNEHLQVVSQAQFSKTGTGGQITVDKSVGIGLQWAF
jgi:hypothetical protein